MTPPIVSPAIPTIAIPHERQLLRLAALFAEHPAKVERTGHTTFRASFAGRCENPTTVSVVGKPTPLRGRWVCVSRREATTVPTWVDYDVPCRRCPPCLIAKRRLWQQRAQAEILHAQRTWMLTLTFSPERRFYYRTLAAVDLAARGERLEALSHQDQFREIASRQTRAFTLAMKRLRKNTAAQVRYLFVVEAHESGDAHCHALLHEVQGSPPVLKAEVQREWHEGFSLVKLVESADGAARYVAKYLAKNPLTRIRASLRYGTGGRV